MAVVTMVVGGATPDGARFAAEVDGGGPVRVAVSTSPDMVSPVFTSSQALDAGGAAKVSIAGLSPSTRYWWQVEDNGVIDTARTGQFLTHPLIGAPATFTIGFSACAGGEASAPGVLGDELNPLKVSNHEVFEAIRAKALAEGWLMWWMAGDHGYPDWGAVTTDTMTNRRKYHVDNLRQPNQVGLFSQVSSEYTWDDHDFADNNSDGTYVNKANALQLFNERWPTYLLPGADGIYRPVQIGRTLVYFMDTRYNRSPNADPDGPSKTMLGSNQLAHLDATLAATTAKHLILLMPSQWLSTTTDGWSGFETERAAVRAILDGRGFGGTRTTIGYGDHHGSGINSGATSPGGHPVIEAASLDSDPGAPLVGVFDVLADTPGRGLYGTITVTDLGSSITVRLAVWSMTALLGQHQFVIAVPAPVAVASGALLRTLEGSHTPVIEARLVSGRPTGSDPEGVPVQVSDGDVTYDGTSELWSTLRLETPGIDMATVRSTFPRLPTDPLAPYGGVELFIRYGVDLGAGGVLWTPLGYYRIQTPGQARAPFGTMRIDGRNRMAAIVEARLLSPRAFGENATLGSVVQALIQGVLPGSIVVWDDNSDSDQLGRLLVVEDSRYQAVKDIADSRGKIFYCDDEGVFRLESPPDEGVLVWEPRVAASREITRTGVHNAVKVIGQGSDDQPLVSAVAIDNNPASPTYFFGTFGQVPLVHETATINNTVHAQEAAVGMLRRGLGAQHQITFASAVNPTLRPWQTVRGTYEDGNREKVVMQQVVIPLGRRAMSGTSRAQALVVVGSLG
jgi:alkaline phosphatase D